MQTIKETVSTHRPFIEKTLEKHLKSSPVGILVYAPDSCVMFPAQDIFKVLNANRHRELRMAHVVYPSQSPHEAWYSLYEAAFSLESDDDFDTDDFEDEEDSSEFFCPCHPPTCRWEK